LAISVCCSWSLIAFADGLSTFRPSMKNPDISIRLTVTRHPHPRANLSRVGQGLLDERDVFQLLLAARERGANFIDWRALEMTIEAQRRQVPPLLKGNPRHLEYAGPGREHAVDCFDERVCF